MRGKKQVLALSLSAALFLGIFIAMNLSSRNDNSDGEDLGVEIQDMIDQDTREVQLSIVGYAMYPAQITIERGTIVTLVIYTDRNAVFKILNQLEVEIGPDSIATLPFDASVAGNYHLELHFPIPPEQAGSEAAILLSEPIRIGAILVP